jgi:hypothetical protein
VTLSVPRLRIVSKSKRRVSCRRKHTTPITTQAQLPLCSVCGCQQRSQVPRASRSAHVLSKLVVELAGAQRNKTSRGNFDRFNPLNAELNPICHLLILLGDLTFMVPCIVSIFQYNIQQDATLHSLFISGNCSTCFGWYFYPSLGAHTPVSTASGICHTVTAICRYQLEPV